MDRHEDFDPDKYPKLIISLKKTKAPVTRQKARIIVIDDKGV